MNNLINHPEGSPSKEQTTVLSAKNIKNYFNDPVKLQVLKDINFSFEPGEFVSIMG